MADKKISQLNTATTVYDADDIAVVQDGETKQANASTVKAYVKDGLSKSDVGLGNVDNTSDANKPVSTATQTALNLKQDAASAVTLTGTQTLTNKTLTSPTINGGTVNNVAIGGTTPAAGNFTTLGATGNVTLGDAAGDTVAIQAGTAALPTLIPNGDPNTGLWFPAADTVAFSTGGSERLRIDSSGNLGLGVTPSAWHPSIKGFDVNVGAGLYGGSVAFGVSAGLMGNSVYDISGYKYKNTAAATGYEQSFNGAHTWYTAPSGTAGSAISFTQAMTLMASGNLLVGSTSKLAGGVSGIDVNGSNIPGVTLGYGGVPKGYMFLNNPASRYHIESASGYTIAVVSGGANGVSLANGGTSWGSLSDERKKDVIEPISNASNKVSSLRAVIGKYKTDEKGVRRAFLIAQDVQAVLPEAVIEDASGDLILQYTDTIPLLVAAIKELHAEIEALKQRIR